MERNERFDGIRAKHPDWSDEQVWMAVSLDMQQDATIDQRGKDINPKDPDIWKEIIDKAKDWLEAVLPIVYEKVRELFAVLLANLKKWIEKGITNITEWLLEVFGRRGGGFI